MSRDAFLARPSVWETWDARAANPRTWWCASARRPARRRIVFLAHVDSGVHRLTTSGTIVKYLPRTLGGITLMGLVGGVLTMLAGRQERWKPLRATVGVSALGAALLAMVDESGPDVAGANGNASGVAVLLALAEALYRRPLESTEVVLAFTGSGTATSTGADVLATDVRPRRVRRAVDCGGSVARANCAGRTARQSAPTPTITPIQKRCR